MKTISIFVATHKAFEMPTNDPIYKPIQGGAGLYPDLRFGYLLDNSGTGGNISLKKEFYNELSSVYWAWKNDDSDIKGICHYRRFLSKGGKLGSHILTKDDVFKFLSEYDVLLPYPYFHTGVDNKTCMLNSGNVFDEDYKILDWAVKKVAPAYYDSFREVMEMDYACYCNMMIAKKELFDTYAAWLFPILEETERNIDVTSRPPSQIRLFGYFGELLLDVFFHHNRTSVKFCYMDVFKEYRWKEKMYSFYKRSPVYWFMRYSKIDKAHRI